MGNRTNLSLAQADGESVELLESVTYFPLFWLLGTLDEPMTAQIERVQATPELDEEDYDEAAYADAYSDWFYQNKLGEVSLPIAQFSSNLKAHKAYIDAQYSPLSSLYERFIALMAAQEHTHPDASVNIEYSELTDFSDTPAQYHQEMAQTVAQIHNNQQVGPDWFDPTDVLLSSIGTDEYSEHEGERLFTSETFDSTERQLVEAFSKKPGQQSDQSEATASTLAYSSEAKKPSFFQRLFRRSK
ncbi:hypothetical protein [Bombiscardovia apis]|nr:hypothetical protein [Bombiscardovia apis]